MVAADAALDRGRRRGRRRSADRKGLVLLRKNSSCRAPSSSTSWIASAPASSARSKACNLSSAAPPCRFTCRSASEKDFKGVVDLVRMKAYTYTRRRRRKGKRRRHSRRPGRSRQSRARSAGRNGGRGQRRSTWRSSSTKALCPSNISQDGLREAFARRRMFPVLCASALHNVGTDLVLNFVFEYFPAPPNAARGSGTAQRRRQPSAPSRIPSRSPLSSSKPLPIRSPDASPTSKWSPAS